MLCVHAAVYGIAQSRDVPLIKGAVGNVMVPEFVPQRGVKIQVSIHIYLCAGVCGCVCVCVNVDIYAECKLAYCAWRNSASVAISRLGYSNISGWL